MIEAVYIGNIGFEEMMRFYRVATPEEEREMDDAVEHEDLNAYSALISRVLNTDLKPMDSHAT